MVASNQTDAFCHRTMGAKGLPDPDEALPPSVISGGRVLPHLLDAIGFSGRGSTLKRRCDRANAFNNLPSAFVLIGSFNLSNETKNFYNSNVIECKQCKTPAYLNPSIRTSAA